MNRAYPSKIKRVVDEYAATREALAYIVSHRDDAKVYRMVGGLPLEDFKLALDRIEITFFVRLFAEFEECLRDYLQSHAAVIVSPGWGAEELINRVNRYCRDQSRPISSLLIDKVKNLKKIRNDVAHTSGNSSLLVTIVDARSVLNIYLSKLE